MQDRNVQFPQRYQLKKIDGPDDVFDLIPAPGEIANEGTFINKATLLKDSTAEKFGLDTSAVPDDVLVLLSRFQKNLGNEYVWAKGKNVEAFELNGEFEEVDIYSGNATSNAQFRYADTPDMQNEQRASISYDNYTNADVLAGKFFTTSRDHNYVYYGDPNGSATRKIDNSQYKVCFPATPYWENISKFNLETYVNNPDQNAYPPAVSDDYNYIPLGKLGGRSIIETGSYIGTGTSDRENPCSINLGTNPSIVFIQGDGGMTGIWLRGSHRMFVVDPNRMVCPYVALSPDNILKWYAVPGSGYDAERWQLNETGHRYTYVAISLI